MVYHGLPIIARWIFPWRTVTNNQRVRGKLGGPVVRHQLSFFQTPCHWATSSISSTTTATQTRTITTSSTTRTTTSRTSSTTSTTYHGAVEGFKGNENPSKIHQNLLKYRNFTGVSQCAAQQYADLWWSFGVLMEIMRRCRGSDFGVRSSLMWTDGQMSRYSTLTYWDSLSLTVFRCLFTSSRHIQTIPDSKMSKVIRFRHHTPLSLDGGKFIYKWMIYHVSGNP